MLCFPSNECGLFKKSMNTMQTFVHLLPSTWACQIQWVCCSCLHLRIISERLPHYYIQLILTPAISKTLWSTKIGNHWTSRSVGYGPSLSAWQKDIALSCPSPQSICHIFHRPLESGSSNTLYLPFLTAREVIYSPVKAESEAPNHLAVKY